MDNRIFNVNGKGLELLTQAIELACIQDNSQSIKGWVFDCEKGIILFDYIPSNKGVIKFIAPVAPKTAAILIFDWLKSDEAKIVPNTGWDVDADHDGSNELGWRVYVEDWGHVEPHSFGVICAIKPAYLWYGK